MSGPDFNTLRQDFSTGQNLSNMSDAQLQQMAHDVDSVTAGNGYTKILDQLETMRAGGKAADVNTLVALLTVENPSLPPPKEGDPLATNRSFQDWLNLNQGAFGGPLASGNLSVIMNMIAIQNASLGATLDGTTTTYTDGSTSTDNPDGSTTTTSADGKSSKTRFPNGLTLTTRTNPDGSKQSDNPDGSTTTTNPDGSSVTKYPDGTTVSTSIDNKVTTVKPDGTTTVTDGPPPPTNVYVGEPLPPGGTTEFKPDGSTITTYKDGMTITKALDGTITTKIPDGSIIVNKPNGTTTTTYADGTSVTGPTLAVAPETRAALSNTLNMMDDMESSIKSLIDSVPANTQNPQLIGMKDFLKTLLSALDKLRTFLRELQAGNSQKARETSNAKLKMNLDDIKKQIQKQEEAEKAAKKQKTMGLVMKIFAPFLIIIAVVVFIAFPPAGFALFAITVTLIVVSCIDQIISMATGQGMLARLFEAISEHLPPGAALAIKAILLVGVIATAIIAPTNAAIALGLIFSMVSSSGIAKDAVKCAAANGMSEQGQQILSWCMTAAIAIISIIGTAGKSAFNSLTSSGTAAAESAAAGVEGGARGAGAAGTAGVTGGSAATLENASVSSSDILNTILNRAKSVFSNVSTNSTNPATFQGTLGRVNAGIQVAGAATSTALGVAGGISDIKQADHLKRQGELEKEIIEIEAMIKALQKLVDQALSGQSDLSEWSNSITSQMGQMFSGWSSQMTNLARASA